ncbi:MAG: glycine cleavage system aminomethyltransferase GcvT [Zetaproteobacteria bacterium]|nr:MAG: glycine cleavage system aminomethyltransferase GcvT [Zetaproteobacteria bacterium]
MNATDRPSKGKPLQQTALHHQHTELRARIVPFAGYAMPLQYPTGALKEYHAVRGDDGAGLFDISHMGQIRVEGREALAFLQQVTTNDVTRLCDGQVHYSALLNEEGGFIDDITTYRLAADRYYLCVNAANRQADVAHLARQAAQYAVTVTDESDATALLALQGAGAQAMLQPLTDIDLETIAYYHFAQGALCGAPALISRTGYTGEDGFELYLENGRAAEVWQALLDAGALPAGLAARDMLRTEMGYALYGHEIHAQVTPVEANLMWITDMDKGPFIGRAAVADRLQQGRRKALIALRLTERGIPREGYPVLADGRRVGAVTSGLFSPLAGCGVALAYVAPDRAECGDLAVEIRGRAVAAERTRTPFVRSRVRRSR